MSIHHSVSIFDVPLDVLKEYFLRFLDFSDLSVMAEVSFFAREFKVSEMICNEITIKDSRLIEILFNMVKSIDINVKKIIKLPKNLVYLRIEARNFKIDNFSNITLGLKNNTTIREFVLNGAFGGVFNIFDPSCIPRDVTTLNIHGNFNENIKVFPSTLKKLTLSGIFNQPIDNLPIGLEELRISSFFNQSVDKLPKTLKKLTLQVGFNSPVNHLPDGLHELIINGKFNQSVDKLPVSLKKLTLGPKFNKPINNLPVGLIELNIGGFFDQKIDMLPSDMKKLKLGDFFSKPICTFPKHLEEIEIVGVEPIFSLFKEDILELKKIKIGTVTYKKRSDTNFSTDSSYIHWLLDIGESELKRIREG